MVLSPAQKALLEDYEKYSGRAYHFSQKRGEGYTTLMMTLAIKKAMEYERRVAFISSDLMHLTCVNISNVCKDFLGIKPKILDMRYMYINGSVLHLIKTHPQGNTLRGISFDDVFVDSNNVFDDKYAEFYRVLDASTRRNTDGDKFFLCR